MSPFAPPKKGKGIGPDETFEANSDYKQDNGRSDRVSSTDN